jgi:TRAP-type C4-dicarboxylate transport system substrate-binding protein
MKKTRFVLLAVSFIVLTGTQPALCQKIEVRLGTVAPEGSPWHEILLKIRQEWQRISNGAVVLRTYPSGVQGDENDMLRKVHIGQLHAVALSANGLARIDRGVSCLQIPMLLESYEELDYLLEQMTPRLEARMAKKGFIVLHWGDVGWVHFFAKKPAKSLEEIRKMKLFISSGDPEAERLYKEFGFHPIPLAVTDMIPSLQTGLIEAFDIPPLFALLDQSFALAKNMIPIKWAPLIGATVVSKRSWERIPEGWRAPMLAAARKAAIERRDEIRKMGDDAVDEMEKRGLTVVDVDGDVVSSWRAEAESAYPSLRGTIVPNELYDEVLRLHEGFRAGRSADDASKLEGTVKGR